MMMISLSEKLTLFPIIPPETGWKLDFFEAAEPIGAHYHKKQKQILVVVDGKMKVRLENREPLLQAGELIVMDPGAIHTLIPEGKTEFFALDIPGFVYPEDVFFDAPQEMFSWSAPQGELLPFSFGEKFDRGLYTVYELAQREKWSVALIELTDSPKHYHKIEKEIFVVVHGTLDIEVDGIHQTLALGESISLPPGRVHQLKSGSGGPVRVLCFSFPAFDPTDMYLVEKN